MNKNEESFPTVIGRVRDTMPSPPDFLGLDGDQPVRVSANGRASFELSFPGGTASIPEPTAQILKDSAFDWVTTLSSEVRQLYQAMLDCDNSRIREMRSKVRMTGIRLDVALAEFEAKCL